MRDLPVSTRNIFNLVANTPGVQGEAALAVDDVVPHPQAALLRLAEVVRVQHARHARAGATQTDEEQGQRRPERSGVLAARGRLTTLVWTLGLGGLGFLGRPIQALSDVRIAGLAQSGSRDPQLQAQ